MSSSLKIGLDLDNTIICYDRAFVIAAKERELVPAQFTGTKQQVRDHIRVLPGIDGEIEWQKLQGHVYGTGIFSAELFAGVTTFLKHAKTQDATVYIISHKTEFGHFDPERINLREAARQFLQMQGIFSLLPQERLFFYPARSEKLQKILSLRCNVFVDDLEEVLTDPAFPPGVRRILFAASAPDRIHDFAVCNDWTQIEKYIFDAIG